MKELESLGVKLDSKLDKINVDKLVTADMKNLNEENAGTKYKQAKWIVRVITLLAEWALVLSLVSCGSDKYTGIDIISKAVRLDFSSWKDWGQAALLVASVLCIAVIVISLFESNKIFHQILSLTSVVFITSLVALVFYTIDDRYKVLSGFYVLVLLYGGMFLISVRGKACELVLLGEEARQGKIRTVPLFNWDMLRILCTGQIVINLFMYIYSEKIMDDSDLAMIAIIVLAWSVVTLIITLMKSRLCELCFMLQSISCVVMMAIGVGFCMHYRIRFRYLVDIMLWLGCLLVSPYRKLKMSDLRDIKTYQHKIKNDSVKIMKEVQTNIQNIDVEGLKSDLSSTYEVVKQTVKETGKAVKSEVKENQSVELNEKLADLKNQSVELKDKLKRVFVKVKPVLKNKVVLVALAAIVVAVVVAIPIRNKISEHKKLEEIYTNSSNAYQVYLETAYELMIEEENECGDLINGLENMRELMEKKDKCYERAVNYRKYGFDSFESGMTVWMGAAREVFDATEVYYDRLEELRDASGKLSMKRATIYDARKALLPYEDNKAFEFKELIDKIDKEIEKDILKDTIDKLSECKSYGEKYDYLVGEQFKYRY